MYLPFSPHQPNDNCMPAGGGGKKKGSCVVGEERGGGGGWKPDSPTRNDCFVQTGGIVPLRISWLLWEPLRRFSFVKVTENNPEPIPTHVVERMKHSILRRKLRKWRKYHAKKPWYTICSIDLERPLSAVATMQQLKSAQSKKQYSSFLPP